MNGFFITISNGLLDKKHFKAIGPAVWVFMWCLNSMTKIDHDVGEGWVFGGETFKADVIANEIGYERVETAREHLRTLHEAGYIVMERKQYGITIMVRNAKKIFGLVSSRVTEKRDSRVPLKPSQSPAKTGNSPYIDNNKDSSNITEHLAEVTEDYEIVDEEDGLLPSKKPASRAKPIFEWAVKVKGLGRVRVPTQLAHINSMLKGGYTSEDIKSKWDELEKEVWITHIDFGTVMSQIGKATVKKSTPKTFKSEDIK